MLRKFAKHIFIIIAMIIVGSIPAFISYYNLQDEIIKAQQNAEKLGYIKIAYLESWNKVICLFTIVFLVAAISSYILFQYKKRAS